MQQARERMLFAMNRIALLCGIVLWCLYLASSNLTTVSRGSLIGFGGLLVMFSILSLEKIGYRVRVFATAAAIYFGVLIDFAFFGASYLGFLFLFGLCIFTLVFSGSRAAFAVMCLGALTIGAAIWLITVGLLTPPLEVVRESAYNMGNVVLWPLSFMLVVMGSLILTSALLKIVQTAWAQERKTAHELVEKSKALNVSLEREHALALALKNSLDKEVSLNKLRAKVVTTVSHEFRTPMTVIGTSTDLLRNYADSLTPAKRERQLDRIKTAMSTLEGLLQQVTAVDETATSNQDEFVPLPFGQFSAELTHFIHNQFDQFNYIDVTYDETDSVVISAERTTLQQLLQIVLSNAVKFGSTHIAVNMARQNNQLILMIEDNGIGVPPDEIDGLFAPFQRGSNVEHVPGLGIGLSIARNLVSSLNGSIGIESDETTVVTIQIPVVVDLGLERAAAMTSVAET